jgi:hypothetical protein
MVRALLLGTAILSASMVLFAIAVAIVVTLMVKVSRAGYAGQGFWKNVAIMIVVTLVFTAAHLIQIALWAGAYLACGEIATFERALYFSSQSYTSLGYGDVVLSERWRLLGPLEAINGLLLFGLSTAAMFAVLSRLVAPRFQSEIDPDSELVRQIRSPENAKD